MDVYTSFSMQVWCDFPLQLLPRAMYCVPLCRHETKAWIVEDGVLKVVPEKSLSSTYLTLRERVLFRRRVCLVHSALLNTGMILYPTWDFNGPDLPFFGEWKTSNGLIRAGPWEIDGRALVADAKDRALQMIEAANSVATAEKPVRLLIIEGGVQESTVLQRGWDLGAAPWHAFFSGVRKAVEVADTRYVKVVVVSTKNPYEGITKFNPVTWIPIKDLKREEGDITCIPFDVFSSMLHSKEVSTVLQAMLVDAPPVQSLYTWMRMNVRNTTSIHRNRFWNPDTRLHSKKFPM